MASQLAALFANSPLRHAGFRRYYVGSVGTALGFTVLSTAGAWLMATLTPSALMVALVQTASTLPTLVFGLIAGSLADLVDRRRIIVGTQIAMMTTGAILGILTLQGWMSPTLLLLLILVLGAAFTFYMPASGAAINEMVSRDELPRAVALGAVAFNVSRAIGPALAGTLASLGAGTQSAAPAWVRARAMAINLLAVQASLAIGSALWGAMASAFGTQTTLFLSAGVTVLLHFLIRNVRVNLGQEADVTTVQLPEMGIKAEPLPNDGPVLVQVEYRIDPHHVPAFVEAIKGVGATRRRNGASDWRIFRDIGEEGKFVERYIVGSWAEYIRLRARMTLTDRRVQEKAFALQRPGIDIRVSRLINVDPDGDFGQHVARPRRKVKTSDTFLRPETEHADPEQVHEARREA